MTTKKTNKPDTDGLIRFLEPGNGAPAALLADVEVPITDGPLGGLKVSGIRVWRRKDDADHLFVTFPGRVYENGAGGTRTYEYLRATDGQGETVKAIRDTILTAYREHTKEVTSQSL